LGLAIDFSEIDVFFRVVTGVWHHGRGGSLVFSWLSLWLAGGSRESTDRHTAGECVVGGSGLAKGVKSRIDRRSGGTKLSCLGNENSIENPAAWSNLFCRFSHHL
jgi:hypothetical protein